MRVAIEKVFTTFHSQKENLKGRPKNLVLRTRNMSSTLFTHFEAENICLDQFPRPQRRDGYGTFARTVLININSSIGKKTVLSANIRFSETKIFDLTPNYVLRYVGNAKQEILARMRFNRLLGTFTGLTCCPLQDDSRTTFKGTCEFESDEVYVGLDKHGAHYVLPVQAKGKKDKLGIVQIEQDFAIAAEKFPSLICKAIAAHFMPNGTIALFELELTSGGISIVAEKHYRLVRSEELSFEELESYTKPKN